jgi:hypothetical protein
VVSTGGGATGILWLPPQSPVVCWRPQQNSGDLKLFADPVNGRSQARPRCPAHALGVTEIGFQRPRVSDAPQVSVYNL